MADTRPGPPDGGVRYASTVIAPGQVVLGAVLGLIAAGIVLALSSGLWPLAVVAVVVAVGVGIYLAPVGLTVEPNRLTVTQGRGQRDERVVYASECVEITPRTLSWPQCFGVGMPRAERVTRLSVRAGPALQLVTTEGELIVISTGEPQRAAAAFTPMTIDRPASPPPVPPLPSVPPLPPLPQRSPRPRPRPGGD